MKLIYMVHIVFFNFIESFENDVKEKIKNGSLSGLRGASYIFSIAVVGVVFFEVLKLRPLRR
jgi:hypothetical protein